MDSVDRHVEHWMREIPDLDPLTEGVVTRMEMLLRHLKQARQVTLAANGLEGYEYATLHFLGGSGPDHRATPGAIASWLQMSPSGITGRLDALEKRGFIRRLPSPGDRRKVIVELTEAGRRAWLSTFDPQANEEARVLGALDPDEQRQFDGMLRKMMRFVDRPGLLSMPAGPDAPGGKGKSRFTPEATGAGHLSGRSRRRRMR